MKTAKPPTPPAAESALMLTAEACQTHHRYDDEPAEHTVRVYTSDTGGRVLVATVSGHSRTDTEHRTALIVTAVNAHAAAQQRITSLEHVLARIDSLYTSQYLCPSRDGKTRCEDAMRLLRLALRHPERT